MTNARAWFIRKKSELLDPPRQQRRARLEVGPVQSCWVQVKKTGESYVYDWHWADHPTLNANRSSGSGIAHSQGNDRLYGPDGNDTIDAASARTGSWRELCY